ncbi:unnamed protein product, partial [Linum tenue]
MKGDPFDYAWISSTDFWVLDTIEENPTPELNYDELEQALKELNEEYDFDDNHLTEESGATSRKRRRIEDDDEVENEDLSATDNEADDENDD